MQPDQDADISSVKDADISSVKKSFFSTLTQSIARLFSPSENCKVDALYSLNVEINTLLTPFVCSLK